MFKKACRKIKPYVVGLTFFNQSKPEFSVGTGTIINAEGLILTANHVLKDDSWVLMANRNFTDRGPKIIKGAFQAVGRFPEHDLALIQIPNLSLAGLKEPLDCLFTGLKTGEQVGSFGYPEPRYHADTIPPKTNNSANVVNVDLNITLRFKSYFIAGAVRPLQSKTYTLDSFAYGGHSGGPVFDKKGRLFGVMVRTELHREKGYEISFCTAAALSNIQSELFHAQKQGL